MTTTSLSRTGRKTRYDKGQVMLTERDLHVLRWIAEQYAARFDQVRELLGREAGPGNAVEDEISESAARQVIARWRRAGWTVCRRVFSFEEPWIHVTPLGLRQLDLAYKPNTPAVARLQHLFAVNEVRLALSAPHGEDRWLSERAIRAQLSLQKGESQSHLPDGVLSSARGQIAIEAELTPKSPHDLLTIVEELAETYAEVWYYVAHEARMGVLAARAKLPEYLAQNVQVYRYPEDTLPDEDED